MKSFSADMTTKATPAQAWRAWTDLPNWNKHDPTIESITIGTFEEGAHAKLKNKNGPGATLIISSIGYATQNLPLCTMMSYHEVVPTPDGGARLVFRTEFTGLLSGLFYALFGKDIARDSQANTQRLSELAETEY